MSATNGGGSIAPILESKKQVAPNLFSVDQIVPVGGLTIRDWFAGQALAGYMAYSHPGSSLGVWPEESAEIAYKVADAMLAVREGKEECK